MLQFGQIARKPLALLHGCALPGQFGFLAHLGRELHQFGQVRDQQILLGRSRRNPCMRLGQCRFRPAPLVPRGGNIAHVRAGIAVQQSPVPAGIDEAPIIMLAVQFDQRAGKFAQQRDTDRLIVHERAGPDGAAALRTQTAADDQRLARLDCNLGLGQHSAQGIGQSRELERRRHARLVGPGADEPGIGTVPQHQAQRIQQDRLAGAGFAREHAETAPEHKVERFDQDHIADGKAGEHRARSLPSPQRRVTLLANMGHPVGKAVDKVGQIAAV